MSTYIPPVGSILRLGAEPTHHTAVVVDPWGGVLEVKRDGQRCHYHHDSPEEWQAATGVDLSVDYRVEERRPAARKAKKEQGQATVERVAATLRRLVSRGFSPKCSILTYAPRLDELYIIDERLGEMYEDDPEREALQQRSYYLWYLLTEGGEEDDEFSMHPRGVSMARSRLTVIVDGVPRSLTVGTVRSATTGYRNTYEGRQMLLCDGRIGPTYESVGIPEGARFYRTLSNGEYQEIARP